jgi:cytochrome b pre-mRNA-processing protein 3
MGRRRWRIDVIGAITFSPSVPASSLRGRANTMILKLFRRTPPEGTIACLYGTIVAQARLPAFYQIYGVPDTVSGRLEMIMLHTVLFLRRLEGEAAPTRALGQGLFDRFCRDMDASMREMGVGDLALPREMRRIGEAFYGRQAAYRAALDAPDNGQLAAALQRNVFADGSEPGPASRLAIYVREAARRLAEQDGFERAQLAFPDPEQVLLCARRTRIEQ